MSGPILITGASGFVGQALVRALREEGRALRLALRTRSALFDDGIEQAEIGDLDRPVDWSGAVRGVSAVIHCAGLAHADAPLPEALYQQVNTAATRDLAVAAQEAGVARFVFLSSVRAISGPSSPVALTDSTPPQPSDAYGRSKLAAEVELAGLDLDWVALRPVVIYGEGVKANMAALLRLADTPWPLPFGALKAGRSLLALENLISAIRFALGPEIGLRRSYLVADPEPITLAGMVTAMRAGFGRPARLWPLPEPWLRAGLGIVGRQGLAERLAGGLVAQPCDLMAAGWRPVTTTAEALVRLAAARRA